LRWGLQTRLLRKILLGFVYLSSLKYYMHSIKIICLLLLFCSIKCFAQQPMITILDSGHKTSLRGLSVVDDKVIWASGSNGTVARSLNGGKTFEWLTVKGYENRDFRDIEAFDANTAIIMGIAEPAVILKTKDGGKTWKEVFRNTAKGMFLDAMDFKNAKHGVVIGDPLTNQPYIAYTDDGGERWQIPAGSAKSMLPVLDSGEAFFASSGTNITEVKDVFTSPGSCLIVSGGMSAKLYGLGSFKIKLPLVQGRSSTGANSVAAYPTPGGFNGVVVGGDFSHDQIIDSNCVLFRMDKRGQQLTFPQTPPHGYRSCVAYLTKDKLITCGTSGIDISNDGGMNWQLVSRQSFHVCQKAKKGVAVFLAGANGKIAKLQAQ